MINAIRGCKMSFLFTEIFFFHSSFSPLLPPRARISFLVSEYEGNLENLIIYKWQWVIRASSSYWWMRPLNVHRNFISKWNAEKANSHILGEGMYLLFQYSSMFLICFSFIFISGYDLNIFMQILTSIIICQRQDYQMLL